MVAGSSSPLVNSLGQPIAADAAAEQAFRTWFGKSLVVDPAGRPLVLYHGTNRQFDAFSVSEKKGIYFSTSENEAHRYADIVSRYGGKPRVIPVYLKIERNGWESYVQMTSRSAYQGIASAHTSIAQQWDGIHHPNDMTVVYHPCQIKAVANRGTFDPLDVNIGR